MWRWCEQPACPPFFVPDQNTSEAEERPAQRARVTNLDLVLVTEELSVPR